jgi:hypothetical protein
MKNFWTYFVVFMLLMFGWFAYSDAYRGTKSSTEAPTYQQPTQGSSLVSCDLGKCGIREVTSSECKKAVCCNTIKGHFAVGDQNTCDCLLFKKKVSDPACAPYLDKISKIYGFNDADKSSSSTNYSNSGSGHEAGYEWAEENDPDDVSMCDGNSSSFNEGCAEYVEEMAEEYPEDYYY